MKKVISFVMVIGLILCLITCGYISEAKAKDFDVTWIDYKIWRSFTSDSNGVAIVGNNDYSKYGAINKNGDLIIPLEFDFIRDFKDGLAWAKKGEVTGYIDNTGEFVKQQDYMEEQVKDGLVVVKGVKALKGRGVMTENGDFILPMKYDYIDVDDDELILVQPDIFKNYIFCVDKTGKKVFELTAQATGGFKDGLAPVEIDGKWGFIDKTGKIVIPVKYDWAYEFSEGLASVELDGKYGFIDKTGEVVLLPKYFTLGSLKDGVAEASFRWEDGENTYWKNGFIDRTGQEVIPIKYDSIDHFKDGLAPVEIDGKWGYIDKTGEVVIPIKYDSIGYFNEELACVGIIEKIESIIEKTKYGFINKAGEIVIPVKYDWAYEFSEGLAPVEIDGKWGYIDKTGEVVIPLKYSKAYNSQEGMLLVEDDTGRRGYIKNPLVSNEEVIP
jgi:hypothetical protein